MTSAISALLPDEVLACIRPRPDISTIDWATKNVRMPHDSKVRGGFRIDLFPYMREPFAVYDDPFYERLTIQTASQVGKTTFAQVCVAKTADTNPHPMAWGEPDERSCKRVIRRTWRLFDRTLELQDKLPPKHQRGSDRIESSTFVVHGAWAGSAASAADFGAMVVVLNETDKMAPKSNDPEADFRYLLQERTKGYAHSKVIELSTPTLMQASYIEKQRKLGDNRSWQVPCPRCGQFDELKTGNGKEPGGIIFDKFNGKLDPHTAEQTARYQCAKCKGEWFEHERFDVMQAGRYVPEGCWIDPDSHELCGTQLRRGKHASFGPLPTLVSLLPGITLGKIAAQWVSALTSEDRAGQVRNYINSWDGRTFDPRPIKVDVEDVARRLSVPNPPVWTCPESSRFVTAGVDTGRVGETMIFYWTLVAWSYIRRGHVIGKGVTHGEDEFRKLLGEWFRDGFDHADGLGPCPLKRVGIDSGRGIDSNSVYTFCDGLNNVWPIKGGNNEFQEWYQLGFQRNNLPPAILARKRKLGMGDLIIVNSHRTQQWRLDLTTGLIKPGAPQFVSIPEELCEDVDWLAEWIADYPDESKGRVTWERSGPNEGGDTIRYALVMAEHFGNRNGYKWRKLPARTTAEIVARNQGQVATLPPTRKSFQTPGGQTFLASQR